MLHARAGHANLAHLTEVDDLPKRRVEPAVGAWLVTSASLSAPQPRVKTIRRGTSMRYEPGIDPSRTSVLRL
jgi:hypothetical protein